MGAHNTKLFWLLFARVASFCQGDVTFVLSIFQVLSEKRIGIVAHFYMDPQVQGVLTSAAERWPHIHISDSLVMADRAVKMVEEGCTTVAVLGVDFMSENVRAILDEAGHKDTKVSNAGHHCGSKPCLSDV